MKNKLFFSILAGIILAVIIGGFFPDAAVHAGFLGEIFLKLLMMIVVPLVIFSMIAGITGLGDIKKVGKLGSYTVTYYLLTTAFSVLIGIILVTMIRPGAAVKSGETLKQAQYSIKGHKLLIKDGSLQKSYDSKFIVTLLDQNIKGYVGTASGRDVIIKKWFCTHKKNVKEIPASPGKTLHVTVHNDFLKTARCAPGAQGKGLSIALAVASKIQGKEKKSISDTLYEVLLGNKKEQREGMIPGNIFRAMVNMEILPLIFFSLLIGLALASIAERSSQAVAVISSLNDAVMKVVDWIMLTAPVGIFGIIAERIGRAGGFSGFLPELYAVGSYAFTVILGLFIHGFLVLPLIYFLVTKKNPYVFLKGVSNPLLNAFSTASSSATLPLTMEAVQNNCGVSKKTSGFILPVGATINMDGTALYEAVAVIFIAQVYGISLGPVEQVIIFLTATLAAVGAAGIPEAGLVTMVIVLRAVGLPLEGVGLILTIDWFLDRCRTTVNVWGDSIGSGVIDSYISKNNLKN